jgi:nucleoside-diphosphate-sugar epimerase
MRERILPAAVGTSGPTIARRVASDTENQTPRPSGAPPFARGQRAILVTGATGFVGRALVARVLSKGRAVRGAVRAVPAALPAKVEPVAVGEIGPQTEWARALHEVDAVVHLAARVHMTGENAASALPLFRAVNATGAERLARAAREAGVRRFVLVSSTTVYGDRSHGQAFDESSPPAPATPYAQSKLEAERLVAESLAGSATELVILRPPLVYGPGAKGNFARLVRLVRRGVPLPLASVHNRRSLVFVGNLVDAIVRVLDHPAAAGRTYVVSDGEDVSTPDLIARAAAALGRPPRLFACPPALLRFAGALLGRADEIGRLLDDMTVDSSRIRAELGWRPPFRLSQGLAQAAAWYAGQESRRSAL